MTRTIQHVLAVLLAPLAFASMSWASAGIDTDAIREILRERVDTYEASVGIVVGVVDAEGRQIVGYGRTVKGGGTEPGGDTLFEIGSISKVFTAILLADLAARTDLELSDPAGGRLHEGVTLPSRDGREITFEISPRIAPPCLGSRTTSHLPTPQTPTRTIPRSCSTSS